MQSLDDGARTDHDLVPVPGPDHSVVWIERSQQAHYLTGLRIGLVMALVCGALVLG